ncbi:MAG TPA: thiamine phosphate synthase [Candidatus Binatia bacterium]|jgi:thiamine-phosphate pyrophosphorylase
MALELPPLYGIIDPEQTRSRPAERLLTALVQAGATILQLRVKALPPADFLELAKQARAITRAHHCRLIINDRIDIALACDADGVHLGQDDLPLGVGRKLMRDKIVGISTHDLDQARAAERDGADYIGFGPMFGTRTKAIVYEARGPAMLQQICSAVKLPIVAIGGITEGNVQEVWQAGADSAAIISDILQDDDPGAKASRILNRGRTVQERMYGSTKT